MRKIAILHPVIFCILLLLWANINLTLKEKYTWPQFRGVHGDGKSQETGLIEKWPESGPNILWRVPIGEGHSSVIAVKERLYTLYADPLNEYIVCLDQANGQEIWKTRIGPFYKSDYGNGPRSTPTFYNDNIFALGPYGHLMAVKADDGALLWSRDIHSEFNVTLERTWRGYSTSPLIVNNLILMDVGGGENQSIVAFDVTSGNTLWTANTEDHPTYSSPLKINSIGQNQIVFNAATQVVSTSPAGQVLWKYPYGKDFGNKIVNPVFIPPDKIFISAIYDVGSSLLQMTHDGDSISINELWNIKDMQNHISTSVFIGNHIYGFDVATLKCLDLTTQKIKWAKRRLGKGSLIYADYKLIVLSERGTLLLLQENPNEYKELCSYRVFDHRVWTPPSLANGLLFLRSPKELVCINLNK